MVIANSKGVLESVGPQYLTKHEHDVALNAVVDLMDVKKFFDTDAENWSAGVDLQKRLSAKKSETFLTQEVRNQLAFYADFLGKLLENEHILPASTSQSPWAKFQLQTTDVPTTTSVEVQKLLGWLVTEYKCKYVAEIGSWLGGTTVPLLQTLRKTSPDSHHLLAVDRFKWHEYMNASVDASLIRGAGKPFYDVSISSHCRPVFLPQNLVVQRKSEQALRRDQRPHHLHPSLRP